MTASAEVAVALVVGACVVLWIHLATGDTRVRRNAKGRLLGFGGCLRCGDSWHWKPEHTTEDGEGGSFPLCEECWLALETPEARWPYYEKLVALWEEGMPVGSRERLYREALTGKPMYATRREQMHRAVMEGK